MPVTHGVAGSSPVQTAKEKNISFLIFCESEISLTYNQYLGLVVQLVRIHACHAWGRGFESRPDRFNQRRVHFAPFFRLWLILFILSVAVRTGPYTRASRLIMFADFLNITLVVVVSRVTGCLGILSMSNFMRLKLPH